MFELLIGKHPIELSCDLNVYGIDDQKVELLLNEKEKKEEIPGILIEFIMKCIEKEPKKRYSWMELFTNNLFEENRSIFLAMR